MWAQSKQSYPSPHTSSPQTPNSQVTAAGGAVTTQITTPCCFPNPPKSVPLWHGFDLLAQTPHSLSRNRARTLPRHCNTMCITQHHPPSPSNATTNDVPQTEPGLLAPKWLAPARAIERATFGPPHPHRRHPTTSLHCTPPPFPTTRPKTSIRTPVWGFWP